MSRKPISKRLRFEIFKRDGFQCQYCGATPPGALLHCDHIEPVSRGGTNDTDNLITACQSCNLGKSDIPLEVISKSLSERAEEVREREEQVAGYQSVLKAKRDRIEDEAQKLLNMFCEQYSKDGIPQRDFISIKRFIELLGFDDCLEAAELACAKFYSGYARSFRYFCGVCWNKIRRTDGEH